VPVGVLEGIVAKRKLNEETPFLKRLKEAGYVFHTVPDDLPITFVLSPTTTVGLLRLNDTILLSFQDEVRQLLRGRKLTSSLSGLLVFPQIMDPRIGSFKDFVTYKRDRSVYVGENIDHEKWSSTPAVEQVDLLAENIANSIRKIRNSRLNDDDRKLLLGIVEQARTLVKDKVAAMSEEELSSPKRIS
jgi:hypothetical protein